MAPPVVLTRSGKLEGRRSRAVETYSGIPYARPPLGDLRFRPPQPVETWQGVRPAQRFGRSAPQSMPLPIVALQMIAVGARAQSEDCLSLNVWTPATDDGRRPVLVWIHGGAFVMGSGSTSLYSGSRLARRGDVVVVTLNYRLGALGYLDLRTLPGGEDAPGNLGLRDQIAALEWVRENIAAFGGNPENVTIFGESAGAMSVATLLGTPAAQGLFHRAITQSGAADHVSSAAEAAEISELFRSELGDAGRDLATLRAAPVASILKAQRAITMPRLRSGQLPWQPFVDADVLAVTPLRAIEAGLAQSVPLLAGANQDEYRLFTLGNSELLRIDEEGLRQRLARVLPEKGPDGTPIAELALEFYGPASASPGRATPGERWIAFQSDRIFHWPAARLAAGHAQRKGATYAYLFTWRPPLLRTRLGACHGLEIPFVFGSLRAPMLRSTIGVSRSARLLSDRMQDAWIAFARSGSPAHAGLPDWPRYENGRHATMVLGNTCREEPARFDSVRSFWERAAAARDDVAEGPRVTRASA